MNDNKSSVSFRTSLGGFNKDDVIQYISDENKRFAEECKSLEARINESQSTAFETEQQLINIRVLYDDLMQKFAEKESEIAEKDNIIKELNDLIPEHDAKLSELTAENESLSVQNEELKNQLDSRDKQIEEYTAKIAALEEKCVSKNIDSSDQRLEELLKENAALKSRHIKLQNKFNSLLERYRSVSPASGADHRRVQEAPSEKKSSFSDEKENIEYISEKAIESIKAINSDVKGYMSSCVGEIDSYTREITHGISNLFEEIAMRCRELDQKIQCHKSEVSDCIDSKVDDFNN